MGGLRVSGFLFLVFRFSASGGMVVRPGYADARGRGRSVPGTLPSCLIPEAVLYQDLDVWQRTCGLVLRVYRVTADFPDTERYGLVVQMRRAAVSLPSNIAEGASRRSPADFQRYLDIAAGSLSELETQCLLSREIGYLPLRVHQELAREMKDIRRMLNALYQSLNRPTRKSRESNRTRNKKQ